MSEITQADRDAAVKAMDQMPHYERGLSFATLNRVLTEAFASHREAAIEEAAQKREHDPWADLTEIDGLVFKMLDELHANVPEAERPKSPSDLSRDQLKRARRAVVLVQLEARAAIRALANPKDDIVKQDCDPEPPSDNLFDPARLAASIRAKLERDRMSYRQAAPMVPTSHATLCRVANGNPPDVETFLRLVRWLSGADTPVAARSDHIAALVEALQAIEPHLDAIVCYASTMGEHEPNRIAAEVRTALSAIRADAIARGDQT